MLTAVGQVGAIKEDYNIALLKFQCCSHTDKGVSAARQVVSLKMIAVSGLIEKINQILPEQIRVMGTSLAPLSHTVVTFYCSNEEGH